MPPSTVTPINPAYSHITLEQARIQLGYTLQDPFSSYWSVIELNICILEALRTFQALTGYYRHRITFTTFPDEQFYYLYSLAPTVYAPTATDTDIDFNIQYSLLEPPTGRVWTGSTQFTADQLRAAQQNCLNKFLLQTGIVQARVLVNVPPPPIDRAILPPTVIDIRRMAWVDNANRSTVIYRDSDFSTDNFTPSWARTPSIPPLTYSISSASPNLVSLSPPPSENGQIDLTYISSYQLSPSVDTILPIPDAYSYMLKWGTLHLLLSSDGRSKDPHRADYCLRRYHEFAEMAMSFPSILSARVNDVVVPIVSLSNLDTYDPNWQNETGKPSMIAVGGRNLTALNRIPAPGEEYGITMDVVGNVPVPATVNDYLQIGEEYMEAIMGYAQHLASFKQGGMEFDYTYPLYKQFLSVATLCNRQISATNFYRTAMNIPAHRQEEEVQRQLHPIRPKAV